MQKSLERILKKLQQRLGDYYQDKLHKVILYGSQARGESATGSDIDVLVVLDGAIHPYREIINTESIVSGISLEHNVVIACVFVSRDRYETHQGPLLQNVRRDGVSL